MKAGLSTGGELLWLGLGGGGFLADHMLRVSLKADSGCGLSGGVESGGVVDGGIVNGETCSDDREC